MMKMDRQKMKVKICLVGEARSQDLPHRRFIQDQFDDRYILDARREGLEERDQVGRPNGDPDIDMTIWTSWERRVSANC